MKLRQKLAVVLASAMVATSVPVVTMAASTNSLTQETLKVKKDAEFVEIATANAVRVKFTSNTGTDETFYLDLENAEWNEDVLFTASQKTANKFKAYKADDTAATTKDEVAYYMYDDEIKYVRQSDSSMQISISSTKLTGTDPVKNIPLFVKAKDGDAKVTIVNKGGTTVSSETKLFATTAEKKMTIAADSDKSFYTSGELSKITVEESYKNALKDGGTFTIELEDSDFRFDSEKITLTGKYGFSAYGEHEITAEISSSDDGKLTVTLPKFADAGITPTTQGTWEITGIKVKCKNKKPDEGDFLVDLKGDDLVAEKTNLKIAKVSNYSMYVKMKDDKAEDVKAGRIEEVEFEIGENVDDSMTSGHEFDMTLENGHWDYKKLVKDANEKGKLVGKVDNKNFGDTAEADRDDDFYKKWALKIDSKWLAEKIIDNDGDLKIDTWEAEFAVDDDKATVETITVKVGQDKDGDSIQSNKDCDKAKFKMNICVPVDKKEKEKVTLKVSGRDVGKEDISTTAINIIDPFKVTYDQAVLKTGLQGQVSGSVTITETDKDCFQKGKLTFKVKKDDEEFGIYLTDATAEVSSSLKGTKVDVKKGNSKNNASMNIDLNRVSKEAATITFKDMKFTTDRTVPEGTYDLEISGTSVDADGHTLVIKDFIKISTANNEDIMNANGLAAATAVFTIDSTKYNVNGVDYDMDAPAYIAGEGYTMIPMRYVANAFGVAPENILFSNGTATFFAGTRTIQLTTNSDVAIVNGAPIKMATKVVNKDGRLYVPVGEIANILSVSKSWDSATKTATFSNVNTTK